jgi:sugar/nucleoside kinase (ribokinase family)
MPVGPPPLVDVVAAGHLCLDIIPELPAPSAARPLIEPGRLSRIGPATVSLGGSVANTGLALHRLGATMQLAARIGDDHFGRLLLELLRDQQGVRTDRISAAAGEATSYSLVISPPGVDRAFLHCSGANDAFTASDLVDLGDCRILHFGYPPLMPGVLADGGSGIAKVFAEVQAAGGLVSLDMAAPDTQRGMSSADWRSWLTRVLPSVDLFLPSFDELLLMLDPPLHAKLQSIAPENLASAADLKVLSQLSSELLQLGARLVMFKLGDQGLYLRSGAGIAALCEREQWQRHDWSSWQTTELWTPCLATEVVGTTGAGDCTIAGLLMGLLQGLTCEDALRHAVAVGAWSVRSLDAIGSIPAWSDVQISLQQPWTLRPPTMSINGWRFDEAAQLFRAASEASCA